MKIGYPQLPSTIRKEFRIHEVLGTGAFGEVIKVQEESSGEFHALKHFFVPNDKLKQNEMAIMASLSPGGTSVTQWDFPPS